MSNPAPTADAADRNWKGPVIHIGVVTILAAAALTFLPCVYLYVKYGVSPPLPVALKAWGLIAAIFGALYVVEPISYYPILGLAGTYMSFLSGNISNLRLPCSAMAQEVVGVQPGTREAEIVSSLGIAGSIVTNLVFVTLGGVAGYGLLAVLPDPIVSAFERYTVPAIFGAVFGQFAVRHPTLAAVAMPIPIVVFILFGAPDWAAIVSSVFGTIGIGRWLYVSGRTRGL